MNEYQTSYRMKGAILIIAVAVMVLAMRSDAKELSKPQVRILCL